MSPHSIIFASYLEVRKANFKVSISPGIKIYLQ
uniref:Uncharacterized protein n=1 Tax=Anguilla anguilla TaxID=7936 RepID=A0A0E9XT06_ANGAN